MLDRRARRAGRPVRAGRRTGRRGRRRCGAQALPRLQPDPRGGARLPARPDHPGVRPPAGLRHRPGGGHPGRQQDRARADRRRHRRRGRHHLGRAARASTKTCAARCCRSTRPARLGARLRAAARLRPHQPFLPETPRNAEPRTGLSMGDHAAITALRWNVDRQAQDELALRLAPAARRRVRARASSTTWSRRTWGSPATRTCAPTPALEKLGALRPVFGTRGPDAERATHDRRQLLAADRRRVHRAARLARSGPPAPTCRCSRTSSTAGDGRGRLRARRRGAADGARVRGAPAARPGRR